MFEALTEKLNGVFHGLGNKGRLTEKDIDEALRRATAIMAMPQNAAAALRTTPSTSRSSSRARPLVSKKASSEHWCWPTPSKTCWPTIRPWTTPSPA